MGGSALCVDLVFLLSSRFVFVFISFLASVSAVAQPLHSATETVRILLAADAPTLTVRSEAPLRLRAGETTHELPAGAYTLRASGATPPKMQHHLFVKTFRPNDVAAMQTWIDQRRAEGFQPLTATLGRNFSADDRTLDTRVYWVSLAREGTAAAAESRKQQLAQRGYPAWIQTQWVEPGQGLVQVRAASGNAGGSFPSPLSIEGTMPIELAEVQSSYWGNKPRALSFTGSIQVRIGERGNLDAIEQLPIEEYLRGVLPAEMSPSWPAEALKAQAVAARSDVVAGLNGRYALEGFDFFATEQSRAYLGATGHAPATDEAVRGTQGEILVHGDRVAPAVFSASCGGWTEDNDAVWSAPPDAALRGVSDLAKGRGKKSSPARIDDWLRARPDAWCAVDDTYFRWKRSYTETELRAIINKVAAVGRIEDIVLGERGESGRLKSVRIRGSQKSVTIEKELPIRRAFGGLPSALFTVHKSSKGSTAQFTFTGGGRGHGVGLCQHGARGMALHGTGYRDILTHYYTGVVLARCD